MVELALNLIYDLIKKLFSFREVRHDEEVVNKVLIRDAIMERTLPNVYCGTAPFFTSLSL